MKVKIFDDMNPRLIALYMDEKEFQALERRAKEIGKSIHAAVLDAIKDMIC